MRRNALPQRSTLMVAVAGSLALAVKLYTARTSFGCTDMRYWHQFLYVLRQFGSFSLYHGIRYFTHPPALLHLLRLLGSAADATGISFAFWLRLPGILADLLSLILVARLLREAGARHRATTLCLMALAPASLMIAGFHGNTDPLMIALVLLAVYLASVPGAQATGDPRREALAAWAGLAFGLALSIKLAALILLAPLFLWWRTLRGRALFTVAVLATALLAWSPDLWQDPLYIVNRVFLYASIPGYWGLTDLQGELALVMGQPPPAPVRFNSDALLVWRLALLSGCGALSYWAIWRRRATLYETCGLVMSFFLFLSPGFAAQYLAWLVPWVAGAGAAVMLIFDAVTGWYLERLYGGGAVGFPWMTSIIRATGQARVAGLFCWLAVGWIAVVFGRRVAAATASAEKHRPLQARRWQIHGGGKARPRESADSRAAARSLRWTVYAGCAALPLLALWIGGRRPVAPLAPVAERFDVPFVEATSTAAGSRAAALLPGAKPTEAWRSAAAPTRERPQDVVLTYVQPIAVVGLDLIGDGEPGHALREWAVQVEAEERPGEWITIPGPRIAAVHDDESSVRFPAITVRRLRVRITDAQGPFAGLKSLTVHRAPVDPNVVAEASSSLWPVSGASLLGQDLDPATWDARTTGWNSREVATVKRPQTLTLLFPRARKIRRITLYSHPLPLAALRSFVFEGLTHGTWSELPETRVEDGRGATSWSFSVAARRFDALRLRVTRTADGFARVAAIALDPPQVE